MILLCIDIGNTNIVLGGFEGERLVFEFRLTTDSRRTVDEYAATLHSLLTKQRGAPFSFRGSIICSVVPHLTGEFDDVIRELTGVKSILVGPGIKTGIKIKLSDPASVGSDRVVNGVAVRELYGSPALVVDFGTATTFDLVNSEGEYEGGIIAPGLKASLESLVERTAKLPSIDLTWPERIVGKSTVHAMQSGALVGYVCLVDGIIRSVLEEEGPLAHVVSTGGLGGLIQKHSKLITTHDPALTLKGMRIIAELNGA